MTDEDLVARLAAVERQYHADFPHEWEDVVRGQRSVEEVVEARRRCGDDPDELAALARVLQRSEPEDRRAMAQRIQASLRARASRAAGDADDDDAAEQDADRPRPAEVVELSAHRERRRGPWIALVGAVFAIAASLLLWLGSTGGGNGTADPSEALQLPSYGLVVRNESVHSMRSASDGGAEVDRYLPRSHIWWMIRPKRPVTAPVALRILVEGPGQPARILAPPGVTCSPKGILELRGELQAILPIEPGRWTLRFIVGPPDQLPQDPSALEKSGPWTIADDAYELELELEP